MLGQRGIQICNNSWTAGQGEGGGGDPKKMGAHLAQHKIGLVIYLILSRLSHVQIGLF